MAEHSPFTQMAYALRTVGEQQRPWQEETLPGNLKGKSKTEQLRELIKERGPISPISLAVLVDLEGGAGLVRALLKFDFNRKSVIARDGKYLWNPDYDAELERDLHTAQRLLLAHGYQVKKPGRQPAATDNH